MAHAYMSVNQKEFIELGGSMLSADYDTNSHTVLTLYGVNGNPVAL